MESRFQAVFESAYKRLVEDGGMPPDMGGGAPPDMGGGAPPDMGGGDQGGGGKAPDPMFATTESIEYLYPFIRLYLMARERGVLPDRVTRYMVANQAHINDMTSARSANRLKEIFAKAGITEGEVLAAKKRNKDAYKKAVESGSKPSIKKVGAEELTSMLQAIGFLGDALRGEAKSGMSDGRAIATDIGFTNKEDFDFSSIWTAYNRIMQVVKGEFRGNV